MKPHQHTRGWKPPLLSKDVRHMTHEASEFLYRVKLGMGARAYSPSTWEAETGGLVQVQGHQVS